MIQKVMHECNRLKATSVAFPALETGNLGFPEDVLTFSVGAGRIVKIERIQIQSCMSSTVPGIRQWTDPMLGARMKDTFFFTLFSLSRHAVW